MRDRIERLLEVHEAHIEWLLMLARTGIYVVQKSRPSSKVNVKGQSHQGQKTKNN